MNRQILYLFFFIFLFNSCNSQTDTNTKKSNYIDNLNNSKQIEDLIKKIDSRYNEFKVNEKLKFENTNYQKLIKQFNVKPWVKADFDHNGLTDILIIGKTYEHSIVCIFDKNGKYEINSIIRDVFDSFSFTVVENNKIKFYYEKNRGKVERPPKLEQKTLIYKFGDFIEETKVETTHKLEKIEFSTSGCFGICPIFYLIINSNQNASLNAGMFNDINGVELEGNYTSVIKNENFEELNDLINYIDFVNLKNEYAVSWTDDQSCILSLTYDDGKIKKISDYGLSGTYGLDRLYQLLFALRENQQWVKK